MCLKCFFRNRTPKSLRHNFICMSEREEVPEVRPDEHAEMQNADEPAKKDKLDSFFTLAGDFRVRLAGDGGVANAVRVADWGLVDRADTRLRQVEDARAAGIDVEQSEEGEVIEEVSEQLHESRLEGEITQILDLAFREFGHNDVAVITGFDPAKLGHRVRFGEDTTFAIPEGRGEEMKDVLARVVPDVLGTAEGVNLDLRFQYLGDKGFTVKYNVDDGGTEREIMFLYARGAEGAA